MAFFRNATVNLLNLHYGIRSIAQNGGAAFFAAYLLKAGVPVPGVFVSTALILVARFLIRPSLIWLSARCGLRALVLAGSFICALEYPLVAEVHGVGAALYAYIAVSALGDSIYWTSFHAYFAALGDLEHRGQQLGARQALAAVVGVLSPLLSGWLLIAISPRAAFDASALFTVLAIVPLAWTPDVKVARHVAGAFKAARLGMALFVSDGWITAAYSSVWQIALFVSLGRNFLAYGGALAFAALAGAVASLVLGHHIDAGHGRRAVWLTFVTLAAVIALRVIAVGHAGLAVLANALGSPLGALYQPTLMTAVYNEAKRSPCVLRFHLATESSWDVGGASALLFGAVLAAHGAPLWAGIVPAFAGAGASFALLRAYYARRPRLEIAALGPAAGIGGAG